MHSKEYSRIKSLADLDLDYQQLVQDFKLLSELAAKVTGTQLSEVNLIDAYTQWTVAGTQNQATQKPRETSICNVTIEQEQYFESLVAEDLRFKDSTYVVDEGYVFYYGIPLKLDQNVTVGSLCVAGKDKTSLTQEQKEQLHLIAKELERLLQQQKQQQLLEQALADSKRMQRRLAHDIRSPLSGLSQLLSTTSLSSLQRSDLESLLRDAAGTASSLLQLTEAILEDTPLLDQQLHNYDTQALAKKLTDLYSPQAQVKTIAFNVRATPSVLRFPRKNLLPIIGNLIANALKFTPTNGKVQVAMHLASSQKAKILHVSIEDNGI
ncbi:MAG TPA: hypothetical protein DCX87_05795, partial [Leeuwenhoekiella sp.]|nr:hypothetical protein [Leeuwenhoekiella sp.]